MSKPELRRLCEVENQILDGDLLLYRRWGLIAIVGRGIHNHAALAAWWDEELMVIETRGVKDSRIITLEGQVLRRPGHIDVYRADPKGIYQFDRRGAVAYMRARTGRRYGWRGVWRTALYHIPFLRVVFRPSTDDTLVVKGTDFCSQLVAAATRIGGGVDSVKNLADADTEPADQARSPFYKYKFTLTP